MPVRLLLEHDHLSEPEEIDSLVLAFEDTLRLLLLLDLLQLFPVNYLHQALAAIIEDAQRNLSRQARSVWFEGISDPLSALADLSPMCLAPRRIPAD
jgi:hypothetical protein